MRYGSKNPITLIIVATVFSFPTLWLLESWIKYVFFVFEIIIIIITFIVITNYYNFIIPLKYKTFLFNLRYIENILIIFVPFLTFLVTHYQLQIEILNDLLALFSTSFIPGYAILKIGKVSKYFSKLETLVLSFVISYIYTGFIWFLLSPLDLSIRPSFLIFSCIILGVIAVSRGGKRVTIQLRPASLCKDIDVVVLLLALGFYIISFTLIYPNFALLPHTDISRHYALSIVLGRTPELYPTIQYLLAHLHESAFIYTSGSSLVSVQVSLLMLNLMLPLGFYAMSKRFLNKIDSRLPALATLFWTLFTNMLGGFTWVYFAQQKLLTPWQDQFQLLADTAYRTCWGTFYGVLGLWYVPSTISFIMLFVLVSFIHNSNLSRKTFFILFSVIFAGMFLTHIAEAIFLASFLAIYGIISKNKVLRIDESIISSAFGFSYSIVIYAFLPKFFPFFTFYITNLSFLASIALPLVALCFAWGFRQFQSPLFKVFRIRELGKGFRLSYPSFLLVSVIIYVYFIAFFSWSSLINVFHVSQTNIIHLVPWFMYPLMLGITGLMGLFALFFVLKERKWGGVYSFLLVFLILALIFGRMMSFINLTFFPPLYFEDRFIWFIKLSLAVLAPIPLLIVVKKLNSKVKKTIRSILIVSLCGAIVLCGISTSFLNVEYWNYLTSNPNALPSYIEIEAVSSLKTIIDQDPNAWLVTVTERSSGIATFATPTAQPDRELKKVIYTAQTPDMVLMQLYKDPSYSHPYIYIASRDVEEIAGYPNSFLNKYIETLPIVFKNSEVTIYNSSRPSFPQEDSDVVLVLPYNDTFLTSQQLLTGYYMLSGGFKHYTVGYDLDDVIFNSKVLVLSYDPPTEFKPLKLRTIGDYLQFLGKGGTMVILNTNGYQYFAEQVLTIGNDTMESNVIQGEDQQITLPAKIPVQIAYPKNSTNPAVNYTSSHDQTSPFIVEKQIGEGELIYVNIYPLLEAFNSNIITDPLNPILSKLINFIELPNMLPNVIEVGGYVKAITIERANIATSTVIFPLEANIEQIEIISDEGPLSLNNVTEIHIENSSSLQLKAEKALISNGKGLYSLINIPSTFLILFPSNDGNLKIKNNESEFEIKSVSKIIVTPKENGIELHVRMPKITAGKALLQQLYSYNNLYRKTGAYGQTLEIIGCISFKIAMADTYIALKDVNLAGYWRLNPSLLFNFDELSTLPVAFNWAPVLLPIFLLLLFIYFVVKKRKIRWGNRYIS